MLDILYSNRVWDWAFAADVGGMYTFFTKRVLVTGNPASEFRKINTSLNKDFQEMMDFYYQ